jgi:hypothetical protein
MLVPLLPANHWKSKAPLPTGDQRGKYLPREKEGKEAGRQADRSAASPAVQGLKEDLHRVVTPPR